MNFFFSQDLILFSAFTPTDIRVAGHFAGLSLGVIASLGIRRCLFPGFARSLNYSRRSIALRCQSATSCPLSMSRTRGTSWQGMCLVKETSPPALMAGGRLIATRRQAKPE